MLGQHSSNGQSTPPVLIIRVWPIYGVICKQRCLISISPVTSKDNQTASNCSTDITSSCQMVIDRGKFGNHFINKVAVLGCHLHWSTASLSSQVVMSRDICFRALAMNIHAYSLNIFCIVLRFSIWQANRLTNHRITNTDHKMVV